ncbi:phage tail tape measure protein, TP901 family [Peptostreptococcus anaerobius 653-L]|uniref:Phage tail tape measure protein, TP901 family n=1 Tax=Peptostreptococcus anaerobius 653-L TaxID=596329 RepID=D3MU78_9FIRM|nr:phage tail tape measure protein [Peptostreptococcus anaerobius]EFD04407.1 phage tail tape measure protein, TP901 family [Peptostreptococcus anaerobius 653-L]
MARVIETVLKLRDEVSKNLKGAEKAIHGYTGKMMTTGKTMRKTGANMESLGRNILALNAPFIAVGGMALKTGMQFDKAMSQVKAVSGATGSEFTRLREKAKEIGATTSKSASDAANGMIYLSQAGYSVADTLKLANPLVKTAIAGNMDMAQSASLLADSMHSANIPIGDSTKYLDQVAKTANLSNTNISQLMEAWIGAGGSLRTANISMSQTNALLGILANAGIKGSEAGTSLSRIFMNLNATSSEAGKAMKKLGINVADSSGKMRSKIDVLKELKSKTDKMTEAERNQYIQMIGGKQYANDLKILLDGMGGTFDILTGKINHSNGALDKMAKTMADNLSGEIDGLKSTWEASLIHISDALVPLARDTIKNITKVVKSLQSVNPAVIRVVAKIVMFTTVFGLLNIGVGRFLKTIGSLLLTTGRLIRLFAGMSMTTLGVMAGILALVAVGYLLYKNWDKVKEIVGKVNDKLLEFVDSTVGIDNVKKVINDLKDKFVDLGKQVEPVIKFIGDLLLFLFELGKAILTPLAEIVVGVLGFAFKILVGIVTEVVLGIATAFGGIVEMLSGVIQVIVGIFQGDYKKAFEGLKKIVKGAVNFIKGIWRGLQAYLKVPIKAVVKLLSKPFHSAVNKVKSAWTALRSLLRRAIRGTISATASRFNSTIRSVKKAWNGLKEFLRHPIRGTINLIRHGSVNGEHRTGKGRIPFDGYHALLHKDEMVLNKHDADEYRKGRTSSKGITKIVNVGKLADVLQIREKSDPEKIARDMAKQIVLLA